jgi:transcriptional regulator with XRE-family HTH domain
MKTTTLTKQFRVNLRRLAAERGLSHRDVAAIAGMHYCSLSRILNGRSSPSLDTAAILAKSVGATLANILSKV